MKGESESTAQRAESVKRAAFFRVSSAPMRMQQKLADPYRRIYEKIFQPGPEPLEWRDVRALFREIGKVAWQPNGDLKVTRNGHVLILRPPPTRDVSGADELLELQRFLERSEEVPPVLDERRTSSEFNGGENFGQVMEQW